MTRREEVIEILENGPSSIKDLAVHFSVSIKVIETDLSHIQKSLHRDINKILLVKPAECISCKFIFKSNSKLRCPKKCPECHSERINPNLFKIEQKN